MKTNPPSKTLHKMTFNHITFNICSQLPLPSAEVDTQAALTFWLGGRDSSHHCPSISWLPEKGNACVQTLNISFWIWGPWTLLISWWNELSTHFSRLYVLLAYFRIDKVESSITLVNFVLMLTVLHHLISQVKK